MLRLVLTLLFALPLAAQTVTLLQFSDYHSHAVPFYAEGQVVPAPTPAHGHAPDVLPDVEQSRDAE